MENLKPINIQYFTNGALCSIERLNEHDRHHNVGEPAFVEYWINGKVRKEEWALDGCRHRRDGPAATGWYEDGSIQYECWFLYGERHRLDGPSIIVYNMDGTRERINWHMDDRECHDVNDWLRENPGLPKADAVELKLVYG